MTDLQNLSIFEEIKGLLTECEFNSNMELIVGYHRIGEIIIEQNLQTQAVASYIGRSVRLVEYMVRFARTFPSVKEVPQIPDGKNVTWNKIIKEHLTTSKEKEEHIHEFKNRCYCGVVQFEGTINAQKD